MYRKHRIKILKEVLIMPFIKNSFNILSEAAASDLSVDTEGYITESEILKRYDTIEEVAEEVVFSAESVPVIAVGEDYLTTMNFLHPFMESNNITSVSQALDCVAEANNLPPRGVGLLVESEEHIESIREKAKEKFKKDKDKNAKNKVLDKIKKGTDLTDNLKKKGFKVKKKPTKKKPKAKASKAKKTSKVKDFLDDL